jgi:sigma-B regulation protein RsbU (phosphoserine phosphatase)
VPPEIASLKILLVEDNPADAYMVKVFLSDPRLMHTRSTTLSVTESVAEAARLIADDKPDIIFTDLGLPDGQGAEVLTALIRIAPDIPIIVLSGNSDPCMISDLLQAGAVDYLNKGDYSGPGLVSAIQRSIAEPDS